MSNSAIRQYEDYLRWLDAKYGEIAVERLRFWRDAQPYRTNWTLAARYRNMLNTISADIKDTKIALERARRRHKQQTKWRRARVYLRRLTAFFAS